MSLRGKIISKFAWLHCLIVLQMVFFMLVLTNTASAQVIHPDSVAITQDSIAKNADTSLLIADSTAGNTSMEDSLGIRISKDALPSVVTAEATDSAVMDMKYKIFSLHGDAKVSYEDMKVNGGKISYNQTTNVITSAPGFDSSGTIAHRPEFSQGQEHFTYDTMQFNFKSKRAIVRNARTQQGEGFVYSEQVKRNPDQSIYGKRNMYTTCSLDKPHFGIRASRIKVIPNRVIVSGSANIEIEQVPTPLFLPFAIFPINERQRSGFQIPSYTIEQQRGLGLTNGGYYFYLNDYVDFLALSNIYSKGSYSVSGVSTYANRYKYNGGLSVSYAYNKTGETYEPGSTEQKDFRIVWRHTTDPKARPGVSFNASVNAGTNSFYSNNSYNVNQIVQNNYLSNITYSKNWTGKPFALTVGLTYNQNVTAKTTDMSLPDINFYVSQINPFQRKNPIGSPRWYEKITMGYSFTAQNHTTFYDSTFGFSTLSLNDFRNGFKHQIPISASYNVLRFINLSFNTTYNEYWLTEKQYVAYNDAEGRLDTTKNRGFYTARDFTASMSLSTRIYGVKMFKKGKLMGIRHVLTPSAGIGYTPDYAASPFNYYYRTRIDTGSTLVYRSPFETSIIGVPGAGQYGNFSSRVNFGLNNNLQIKVRSKNDTTGAGKNVTLIDQLSISSSYDIAADSFNLSNFNINFRTNILDKISIGADAVFDPYGLNYSTGRRNRQTLAGSGNGLARFQSARLALGANFRSKPTGNGERPATARTDEFTRLMQNGGYNNYIDFNIPWSLNIAYSLTATNSYQTYTRRDSLLLDHYLTFSGDFNLTPRWKVTFNSGYNFTQKQLAITSIEIYRDMHCWEMRLSTIPFGLNKSYTFTLNVKAAILQDLRLLRRRDYRDAVGY